MKLPTNPPPPRNEIVSEELGLLLMCWGRGVVFSFGVVNYLVCSCSFVLCGHYKFITSNLIK